MKKDKVSIRIKRAIFNYNGFSNKLLELIAHYDDKIEKEELRKKYKKLKVCTNCGHKREEHSFNPVAPSSGICNLCFCSAWRIN